LNDLDFDHLRPGDEDAHADLMRLSFGRDAELAAWLRASVGFANTRVLRRDGRPVASTALLPLGLWMMGQVVPGVGVANVAVRPELRGRSLARRLLDRALDAMRADGAAVAVLFSDAAPVYRRMGFAQAGWRFRWACDPIRFAGVSAPPPLTLPPDLMMAAIRDLNARAGAAGHGRIDRSEALWRRKTNPYRTQVDPYLFAGADGAPAGYALVHHRDLEVVEIKDWVALDPVAAAGIGALVAGTRSTTRRVTWDGGPDDRLVRLADRQPGQPEYVRQWYLRVLDPARAMLARGWPRALTAQLEVAVEGFPPVAFAIADGAARLMAPGAYAPLLEVDRLGFGPLFTGQHSASTLAADGLARGSVAALAIADLAFAAPPPWMTDEF
jgi:predicted acetyltransferase